MGGLESISSALLTLGLVAVAVAISLYERLDLERDIGIAVVRAFVQLTAIGFVINFIFGLESIGYVVLFLCLMVGFASWTAAGRGEGVSGAWPISALSIGTATAATLGMLLVLQVVPSTARYLIPLGGMVVGNSMNTASLTMSRLRDDVKSHHLDIEAALALGATRRQAVSPVLKTSLKGAMIPLIDSTKTTGLIFLPGAMAGMIIGGADPLEAVRLQIVVMYMLLGSVSIAAIMVALLSYRTFFTPHHQLKPDST